jgi:hypothetical protein
VSCYRRQGFIAAPLDVVWSLVGDPARYPEWASNVIEVTGVASLDEGTSFRQRTRTPLGSTTSEFVVDELDDLREIRLRCLASGYYSRWTLTEARGDTFADVEIGMEPTHLHHRGFDALVGRRWYRRIADDSLAQLADVARAETDSHS